MMHSQQHNKQQHPSTCSGDLRFFFGASNDRAAHIRQKVCFHEHFRHFCAARALRSTCMQRARGDLKRRFCSGRHLHEARARDIRMLSERHKKIETLEGLQGSPELSARRKCMLHARIKMAMCARRVRAFWRALLHSDIRHSDRFEFFFVHFSIVRRRAAASPFRRGRAPRRIQNDHKSRTRACGTRKIRSVCAHARARAARRNAKCRN